jgi:hypothetical protein
MINPFTSGESVTLGTATSETYRASGNLDIEGLDMDIASPFVVVPVIVATFFACILWATRGNPDSHQPTEPSVGHMPDRHA